jgi:MoaA/NifB/PqqE/SkfB family radical SAM enzyme
MNDFFCAAPWRGLHINPRGDVKTCCAGNPNMLGNLNEHTIVEILQGPVLQEIRQTIAQGKAHAYCYNCVQAERHGRSERDWHNSISPEFDCATATNTEHVPALIDVRWNTTCNLSCNYCGELCSSKWADLKGIPVRSGARPYYEQVCDYLLQHQSNIREVALVGGEPLLLPENNRLLDVIPNDCIVTLITNMSVELDKNKIFAKLAQRNRVGWSMSFDNIGPRFEYVRYGGKWDMLTKNLATIKDLMQSQGHWGGIHAVYNIYNATRICELREFAEQTGTTVVWQNLFQPKHLDPFLHGPKFAQLAIAEIERFYAMGIATPTEQVFFDQALQTYRAIKQAQPGIKLKFITHIQNIENQYHNDQTGQFKKLWPEIYKTWKN